MRRYFAAMGFALATPLVLNGCQEGTLFADNRANIAGAASVVDPATVEPISAIELRDTINLAAGIPPSSAAPPTLDDAIINYERPQTTPTTNKGAWANLRNALQDRILLASQSRCGFYEEYLKRFQSNSATFFGSLATILGGAGAIVTGADGARALAGLAGISSGVGAEMQKDLFASVTSTVIVPGIEKRRAAILQNIITNRCQTPDRYTIGLALTDALAFHSACSMDVGIAEGGYALKQAANPGTAGMAAFISLGGQINQAQSVRVSIDKNRNGGGSAPSTTTVASSVDVPDSTVQNMLKTLDSGMTIAPCATDNGQPPPSQPQKSTPVKKSMASPPAAVLPTTPPAAAIPPATPTAPMTPAKPG